MNTRYALLAVWLALASGFVRAHSIVVASTTSTAQSGLFAHILPKFKQATGIDVKVVALGTGQAIDIARRGDADVLLVHEPAAEAKFVADGFGAQRRVVMFNDFVLVGPSADPAGVKGSDIALALRRVAAHDALFVSRGDNSGTHSAELRYWAESGVGTARGRGYRECGCGMGQALNIAAGLGAYVLTDRGTWLNFRNKTDLQVLVEGDQRLLNQYSAILVSVAKHPHVKAADGQRFIDWLTGPSGQAAIADYKIDGQQVFFPNNKR